MHLLVALWTWLGPAQQFVSAVALAMLTAFCLWLFRAKVQLIWGTTSSNYHDFKLSEDGGKISVVTEKFYIQNTGRKAATDIEVVFSAAPTSYNLWSPRDHNRKFLENGNFVVHVPSLAPKELLIVDMIDLNPNAPRLLAVNCPDNLSWRVEFAPIRQFGFWVNSLIAYFMLAGLIGTIYLGLQLAFGA